MSPHPRFGDAEMARRHDALAAEMAERDVAHALVYGANRTGSAVGWLTRWPVTREALVVVTPGEPDLLLVNFYNHVPNAERIAAEAEVRWAGERPMETAIDELRQRGGAGARIGLIGPVGWRPHAALSDFAGEVVPMDDAYTRLARRSHRPARLQAARRAHGLRHAGPPGRRLYAAAARQVRGGARLAADRV